ncbi:MAG: VOC family protein [Patescibacteria group bacterium]|nr:VOC family protein [Patescibacteria group bacterium]
MSTISYFEIQAEDSTRAREFYSEVFGWEFVLDKTIPVEYWRIEMAGIYGGLLHRAGPTPPMQSGTNAFTCSMQVTHFDETAKKIMEHGGMVALEKFAVVGKCWQGYFLDTEKNVFGIFEVDEHAK